MSARLFIPGFGARASLYAGGLPGGWEGIEPPRYRREACFASRRAWLLAELEEREGPVLLGGHSMGAALALAAAARRPDLVAGVIALSPAGLPLGKPIRRSLRDLASQVGRRRYPAAELVRSAAAMARAPRGVVALARELRALDLRRDLEAIRAARVPVAVVGCATDTLTPPEHCRAIARLAGGLYREVRLDDGHMWMLAGRGELARQLRALPA